MLRWQTLTLRTSSRSTSIISGARLPQSAKPIRTVTSRQPGEPDWNSYLIAPAIPDWPSAHATGGGAAAEVLAGFFGTDFIEFNMTSGPPYAGTTRWFSSFSEAALENANSRALAGIHFREASVAGLAQGQRIGTWVFANHLRPLR